MAKKILLADDSITIQKVVELTFSDGDYEVTAVNNGAKAIQKLAEMRPDIILSDIIMPEKNGYEVCEFVKSHPDFRSIPVVLLTGTFEPFDPDRADKAGCDAVVTKPFESQSLIHKVEELIEQSRAAAPAPQAAAPPPPPPSTSSEPSPWSDEPAASAPAGFSPAPAFVAPPPPAAGSAFTHDNDIFNAAPEPAAPAEMPIEAPADSPFGTPDAEYSGETKAFARMSFDELSSVAPTQELPTPAPASAPEPPPWDEQPASETESPQFAETPAAPEPVPASAAPAAEAEEDTESPFGAPPPADQFSSETRAFPRMTLDELNSASSQTPPAAPAESQAPAMPPWDEPAAPAAPAWAQPAETPAAEAAPSDDLASPGFEEPAALPSAPEPQPAWAPPAEEPAPAETTGPAGSFELNDEQIDRIARRVVQLMSDQVVRNIAWEVVPDLAEMVVKERIRQLEAEG